MPPNLRDLVEAEKLRTGRPITKKAFQRAIVRAGLDRPVRLRDGTLGYRPEGGRADDCFRAALATVLRVKPEHIPDSQIDERLAEGYTPEQVTELAWQEFFQWLPYTGLRMEVHRELPIHLPRWVGIARQPGDFQDHCLAMEFTDVLWDPGPPPLGGYLRASRAPTPRGARRCDRQHAAPRAALAARLAAPEWVAGQPPAPRAPGPASASQQC
jgi:hypothetical protein